MRGGAGLFFDRAPANTVYGTVNNPPFTRNVTVRYGELQNLSTTGLATEAPPSLTVWQIRQQAVGLDAVERRHPDDAAVLDRARRRLHRAAQLRHQRRRQHQQPSIWARRSCPRTQNPALATSATSTDPATSYASTNPDLVRFYTGLRHDQPAAADRLAHLPLDPDLGEPALPQRAAVRLQRHHQPVRQAERGAAAAAQRRRHDHDPGRPGEGRRAARRQPSAGAPDARAVRLGAAAAVRVDVGRARVARLHRQRLEPVRHLVGRVGPGLHRHRRLPERRRQREPHRLARLRAARPRRRRPGRRLQRRSAAAVQHRRVPRARSSAATVSSRATAT